MSNTARTHLQKEKDQGSLSSARSRSVKSKKRKIKTKKKGSISRGDNSSRSMMSKSVVDICSAADEDSDESDFEKYAANIPPKKSQFFKANELSEENSNSSEDDET